MKNLFLFAILLLTLPTFAQDRGAPATTTAPALSVSYYGIYVKENKLGSVVLKRDDSATWAGKPAIRTESQLNIDMSVMGTATTVESDTTSFTEPKTGHPLYVETRTDSGGAVSAIKATYTQDSVSYEANVTGSIKKDTLHLKPGEVFLSDPTGSGGQTPQIGMTFKGKVFLADPLFLNLVDSEIEVVSKETIVIGGQSIPAYKVVDKNPTSPATMYLNEAGDMLRTDSILGMQIRRESKEVALAPAGKKAELTSIVRLEPSGVPLTDARHLRKVQFELKHASRHLPPDDSVQTVKYTNNPEGAGEVATITITAHPLPDGPTVPLFPSAAMAPERLRPYLQSTLYVTSETPEFKALAAQLVGNETDAAKVAARIAAYVSATIKPDPAISNLRAATDLKRDPRGVCRDFTLFYTTIARAAGLPTKQCVGIVYASGAFFGHAWPEVWVGTDSTGKDRWVALEPTWGVPFADATHIKISEGEITDFFLNAADMGKYEIKVLSAE
jgi:hypothetical protein